MPQDESDACPDEEMELQFRLDRDGRTTYYGEDDSSKEDSEDHSTTSRGGKTTHQEGDDVSGKMSDGDMKKSSLDTDQTKKMNGSAHMKEEEAEKCSSRCGIDYSSKAMMTNYLADDNDNRSVKDRKKRRKRLDDLLYDCEITDSGLFPRTFWMPADGTKARCALEQMALEIFYHHVPNGCVFDPAKSGAEWWVQIRPSPPTTGRYAMFANNDDDDNNDSMSKTGISFHWDKDEDLRLLMGGSMFIHPHLSTVTYLTDYGAPTMVINQRVNNFTGEWLSSEPNENANRSQTRDEFKGFVSWPKQGKHLSFDGRYLHAAPPDLMEKGMFEKQCSIPVDACGEVDKKILQRRHRRVTFLVNIWLNYKPFNVNMFPETMVDKLTAIDESDEFCLFPKEDEAAKASRNHVSRACNDNSITIMNAVATENYFEGTISAKPAQMPTQLFSWPLGGQETNEIIKVQMPVQYIRDKMEDGGNVRIFWTQGQTGVDIKYGVRLLKEDSLKEKKSTSTVEKIKKGEEVRREVRDGDDTQSKRQRAI